MALVPSMSQVHMCAFECPAVDTEARVDETAGEGSLDSPAVSVTALQQQLANRVRAERALRAAKVKADEQRAVAEQVRALGRAD